MVKKIINKIFFSEEPAVGTDNETNRSNWLKGVLNSLPEGSRILDAGAGELKYKKFCSHLEYVSQDFGGYDGKGDGNGLQSKIWDNTKLDIVSDIKKIPVKDAEFDAAMCVEVLEHIIKPDEAIREISRILKPGGKLILTAPFCSMTHMAPYFFQTGFSKYWYQEILKDNNLEILKMDYNGNYFAFLAQEIRRLSFMEKNYTDKKITSNFIQWMAVGIILKTLDLLSKNNKNSEEMLCFGLHILAKKK
jgi:SAM-dependent methyltransferase